jgi:hypothetical protein
MAPTLQKAIIVQQDGSVALREIAVPKPGPDEILVKIVAAAQNPTDCGWASSMIREMRVFIHPLRGCCLQGRRRGTEGAPGVSLDVTFRESSRRLGQMSRRAYAL